MVILHVRKLGESHNFPTPQGILVVGNKISKLASLFSNLIYFGKWN